MNYSQKGKTLGYKQFIKKLNELKIENLDTIKKIVFWGKETFDIHLMNGKSYGVILENSISENKNIINSILTLGGNKITDNNSILI